MSEGASTLIRLLETDHLDDQLAALAWLTAYQVMAGVATIAGLIVKKAPRCIRRTHDHHVKDSSAHLGPVKALHSVSPRTAG